MVSSRCSDGQTRLGLAICISSLAAILSTCSSGIPPWQRGQAWPSRDPSSLRFYLDVDKAIEGGDSNDRAPSDCKLWDLRTEEARLVTHLERFEQEMDHVLRPFSVHVFAWGRGNWARYLQGQNSLGLSFHPSGAGELQRVIIPMAAFGVDISVWRHELGHVLIHQLQGDGKLMGLPSWLEEAFCEWPAGSLHPVLPFISIRAWESLNRSRDLLYDQSGGLKKLEPEDCMALLQKPSVPTLFYRHLLFQLDSHQATMLKAMMAIWSQVQEWRPQDLTREFQRFLEDLNLGSEPRTFERLFEDWVSPGIVSVSDLEFLLLHMSPWRFSPALMSRIASCAMKDPVANEAQRFSVKLVLFQAWWLSWYESPLPKIRAQEGGALLPYGRLAKLLTLLSLGNGLGRQQKEELKRQLGPLICLVYPLGITENSVFELREEVIRAVRETERDPREVLKLIVAAYPIMVPRWGLSPWAGALPEPVASWLKVHLPAMRGECVDLRDLLCVRASAYSPCFRQAKDGWLPDLLHRHGLEIRLH